MTANPNNSPASDKPGESAPLVRASVSGIIPGYKISHEIGRGSQGVVFEAVHEATGRRVALKLLTAATDPARFARELETLVAIGHRNIAPVLDRGVLANGLAYFATPFISGKPLDAWLASRPRSETHEEVALLVKVCNAVDAANERGIIHRNLHAHNILVNDRAEPYVLDFGLDVSPPERPTTSMTTANPYPETPVFASPEQLDGSDLIDARSNVYSLGAMLQQIAIAPPLGDRLAESQIKSASINAIIQRSLATQREARYATAGELAEDIQRAIAGKATTAEAEIDEVGASRESSLAKAIAAAVVVAAILMLAVWLLRK